jgi:long-chain acyl-CoA synthetase
MSTIQEYFTGKTVLVTGATGFLGKALVEKMLRSLPGLRRLCLLIRPKERGTRTLPADQRFRSELLTSSIFDRLKRELGDAFDATVDAKVRVVAGELADERLGVSEDDYRLLTEEVEVLINSAAVVVFDERLDLSLNLNTFGAKRMLEFARDCRRLESTVHISTCYVSGMASGWVAEEVRPFSFDADEEADRLARECDAVKQRYAGRPEVIKDQLVKLGLRSARACGWNDTYTFTKALGEQLILKHRGDLPTVILRPSIIESAFAEPEPGWIDGFRMGDPLFVGYGKGYLQDFPGRPDTITDLIPCDHVVNAILAAAPRCATERGFKVYQVATGELNPVQFRTIYDAGREYFIHNPMRDKEGKLIPNPVWTWPEPAAYRRKLLWRYKVPLEAALALLRPLSFLRPIGKLRRRLALRRAGLDLLFYYIDIYSPYTTIASRFRTGNTARLWDSLDADDRRLFPFDATGIDWHDYIGNVHIPGLKRHVLNLTVEDLGEGIGVAVRTIPDLLARSADRFPETVALQMKRGDRWVKYTYDELERRVGAAADVLHRLGIHKGDRVLLYAENQPEWGIAYLAVVSLGAVVVPVDRQLGETEVLATARFVEAKAVLASESTYAAFVGQDSNPVTATPTGLESCPTKPLLLDVNAGCRPFDLARVAALDAVPAGGPHSVLVEGDDLAAILFTTGGGSPDPRGVMLTHRNLLANVMGVVQLVPPRSRDRFLSVLPLHHALEFTGGFLVPLYVGATVTYCDTMRSQVILDTMRETRATCLIGAPRVFQVLHEAIRRQVARRGRGARLWFDVRRFLSRAVLTVTGRNVGRRLFGSVHEQLGGKLRAFISGGAALAPQIFDNFTALGFELCEGYGLTEAAPVVSVNPLGGARKESVGLPLPGVEVRLLDVNERGVGQIVVRGPNVTAGYYRNPAATAQALHDGWLHTGDVGYLDREGYLVLTGRTKDVIVTPAGKNVYPEEIEHVYAGLPGVHQLCVVGVWDDEVLGETIHAVIVPKPESARGGAAFEEGLRLAIYQRGRHVPRYQRLQRLHFSADELPRTLAGGVDRVRVKQELLARLRASGVEGLALPGPGAGGPAQEPLQDEVGSATPWRQAEVDDGVLTAVARVAGVPRGQVTPASHLDSDLHLDPLHKAELLLTLEEQFHAPLPEELVSSLQTAGDVLDAVKRRVSGGGVAVAERALPAPGLWGLKARGLADEDYWLRTSWAEQAVRAVARRLMELYAHVWFGFEVEGAEHLPKGAFIVAANHCSHLDTGAVVTAFGPRGRELFIMGARDYFFNRRLKGWFFHTFLNVIPFDRSENVIEGLRLAQAVLRAGRPVLIYPEGRRSRTGELQPFKAGIGLLGVELGVPVVPCRIEGTHASLPKGRFWPRRSRVRVRFGAPIAMDDYRAQYGSGDRRELWRRVAEDVRAAVDRLRGTQS